MQDIYKAEKIGRNWCIAKNGVLFRTIGAYRGSEDRAIEQAAELSTAFEDGKEFGFTEGYNNGFNDGVADVSFTIPK
jgi:hypothetical protein